MSLAILHSYDTNQSDDINPSAAFLTIDEGADFASLRRFLSTPIRPAVKRPVRDLKDQFVSVISPVPDVKILTRKERGVLEEELPAPTSMLYQDAASSGKWPVLRIESANLQRITVHVISDQPATFEFVESLDEVVDDVFALSEPAERVTVRVASDAPAAFAFFDDPD